MFRKLSSMASVLILLLSLCGCSAAAKANSTYAGIVTKISSNSITLKTEDGKVTIKLTANTQFSMGGFGGFGQMPEGEWPANGQHPERGEKPEGDFEFPEGQMPSFDGAEMPDFTQFPDEQVPEGMSRPEGGSFEGFGGFNGMNASSIAVGTYVTIATGADKTAANISLSMNFQNFGGQMPNIPN